MAITSTTITPPGGSHSQGFPVRTVKDCAPFSIFHRLAAGGCTPIPKKLSAASSSMESASTEVA